LQLREADIEELTIYSLFLPSECSRGSYYSRHCEGTAFRAHAAVGTAMFLQIFTTPCYCTWTESMLQRNLSPIHEWV